MFGRRLGNLQIVANKPSAKSNVLSNGPTGNNRITSRLPTIRELSPRIGTSSGSLLREARFSSGQIASHPLNLITGVLALSYCGFANRESGGFGVD
jgi:hypothetical protein